MTPKLAIIITFLSLSSGFAIGFVFGYFFKQGKD